MFNPAKTSEEIKRNFVDYIATAFPFEDEAFKVAFREELERIIAKGPMIDIKDIFSCGRTLNALIDDGILSTRFRDIETGKKQKYMLSLPLLRPLYKHQERAIDIISTKKKNAVITTGTGSGKTECFLIPLINELLQEQDAGTLNEPGIRALLIYPMNALANDQMKRLRNLLMYYPDIKFGVYNGDTRYRENDARKEYIEMHENEEREELRSPLDNELISREQMQEAPPHILCTNYAMLEHMLLRPDNDKLFAGARLKLIVLDEAHVYTGATGMETAFLLRRLRARIDSEKVRFILTSATLGKEGQSEQAIIDFATNLTGEPFIKDGIIFGKRDENQPVAEIYRGTEITDELIEALAEQRYGEINDTAINEILRKSGIQTISKSSKANLYHYCNSSYIYRRLRDYMSQPISIQEFSANIGFSQDEIVKFIYVLSGAEDDNKRALVDIRYHFFLRALEGAYAPLYGNNGDKKRLYLTRRERETSPYGDVAVFELALCKNCGKTALVGKIEKGDEGDKLVHADKLEDLQFFQIDPGKEDSEEDIDDEFMDEDIDNEELVIQKTSKTKIYLLCPKCASIRHEDEGNPMCRCGVGFRYVKYIQDKEMVLQGRKSKKAKCVRCYGGEYNRFYLGTEAATAVIATSLFEELPTRIIKGKNDSGIELERTGGKQFLTFSDSRSEAAFFAVYMDKSYKIFLRRRGLIQLINQRRDAMVEEPYTLDIVAEELAKLFKKSGNRTFADELKFEEDYKPSELNRISLRNAWVAILSELTSSRNTDSLTGLGYLKFEYLGNDARVVKYFTDKYKIDEQVCKALLDELVMSFAHFGAIIIGEDDDVIDPEDKKFIFFTQNPKSFTRIKQGSSDDFKSRYYAGWCARNREGEAHKFFSNIRLKLVQKTIKNIDEITANQFLDEYFTYLTEKVNKSYRLIRGQGDIYRLNTNSIIMRIFGDPTIGTYVCNKCGKVTSINVGGNCSVIKCDGILTEFDSAKARKGNHYVRLYESNLLGPMLIKEHTAQLSREEGLRYQQNFEKNLIHALSCSTTFEMGVDVGELETVMLRNVPPSAANYAQRAGRAGRSKHSAAYAATYAKLSSHDFHYFVRPSELIVGKITPPIFKTDNEKILKRHIYAVVFSYFFKHYGYFNDENNRPNRPLPFLEGDGFAKFLEMLSEKPTELSEILRKSFGENLDKQFGISDFSGTWVGELISEDDGILFKLVKEHNETVAVFQERIDAYYKDRKAKEAQTAENQLDFYRGNKRIIECFARGNILPRYGFPVDTVELDVNGRNPDRRTHLNLSRDLKLALSEYAPGERVIANGKLYTSRYIKKSILSGNPGYHRHWVNQCTNQQCEAWNFDEVFIDDSDAPTQKSCLACGEALPDVNWRISIEPRDGFISDGMVEEVPMSRPEKLYVHEASYIGDAKKAVVYKSVDGMSLKLYATENDRILITSKTTFYVCNYCGYALGILDKREISKIKGLSAKDKKQLKEQLSAGRVHSLKGVVHQTDRGAECKNGEGILKRYRLNHSYFTDIITLELDPLLSRDHNALLSVAYAILDAMSAVLKVERTDIDGCLKYSEEIKGLTIVLFDAVSGGAGHVKRLVKDNGETLTEVLKVAFDKMSRNCCDESTSCYMCLRNYYNQRVHDLLKRGDALRILANYQTKIKLSVEKNDTIPSTKIKDIRITREGTSIYNKSISEALSYAFDGIPSILSNLDFAECERPSYCSSEVEYEGRFFLAPLLWFKNRVILFDADDQDITAFTALRNASKWKIFCLGQDFNAADFISAIKGDK